MLLPIVLGLSPPSVLAHPLGRAPAPKITTELSRRKLLIGAIASVSMPRPAHAADSSVFVGTFSDPINHPGGTRTIRLLDSPAFGGYRLARVDGGGGRGEPQRYTLPAVVLGDRRIIIDFQGLPEAPKGGPRDYPGVYDPAQGGGIRFPDGNRWPRVE